METIRLLFRVLRDNRKTSGRVSVEEHRARAKERETGALIFRADAIRRKTMQKRDRESNSER